MSNLHKVPAGILAALSLKTLGRNPVEWLDQVRPTADIFDHYVALLQRTVSFTTNLTVVGDALVLAVPQGFVWRVHGASARLDAAIGTSAAQGVELTLNYRPNLGSPQWTFATRSDPAVAALAAAKSFSIGFRFDRPLLAVPGSSISCILFSTLSAATPGVISALVEPLFI